MVLAAHLHKMLTLTASTCSTDCQARAINTRWSSSYTVVWLAAALSSAPRYVEGGNTVATSRQVSTPVPWISLQPHSRRPGTADSGPAPVSQCDGSRGRSLGRSTEKKGANSSNGRAIPFWAHIFTGTWGTKRRQQFLPSINVPACGVAMEPPFQAPDRLSDTQIR